MYKIWKHVIYIDSHHVRYQSRSIIWSGGCELLQGTIQMGKCCNSCVKASETTKTAQTWHNFPAGHYNTQSQTRHTKFTACLGLKGVGIPSSFPASIPMRSVYICSLQTATLGMNPQTASRRLSQYHTIWAQGQSYHAHCEILFLLSKSSGLWHSVVI